MFLGRVSFRASFVFFCARARYGPFNWSDVSVKSLISGSKRQPLTARVWLFFFVQFLFVCVFFWFFLSFFFLRLFGVGQAEKSGGERKKKAAADAAARRELFVLCWFLGSPRLSSPPLPPPAPPPIQFFYFHFALPDGPGALLF